MFVAAVFAKTHGRDMTISAPDFPSNVRNAFDAYPQSARDTLTALRGLIFETAAANPKIGPLTETLKWGEPSYLTEVTKSGSTLRIAWKPSAPDYVSLFINCQTTLVEQMKELYPDEFTYTGTRAVSFKIDEPLARDPLAHCIEMTLMYHKNKR